MAPSPKPQKTRNAAFPLFVAGQVTRMRGWEDISLDWFGFGLTESRTWTGIGCAEILRAENCLIWKVVAAWCQFVAKAAEEVGMRGYICSQITCSCVMIRCASL